MTAASDFSYLFDDPKPQGKPSEGFDYLFDNAPTLSSPPVKPKPGTPAPEVFPSRLYAQARTPEDKQEVLDRFFEGEVLADFEAMEKEQKDRIKAEWDADEAVRRAKAAATTGEKVAAVGYEISGQLLEGTVVGLARGGLNWLGKMYSGLRYATGHIGPSVKPITMTGKDFIAGGAALGAKITGQLKEGESIDQRIDLIQRNMEAATGRIAEVAGFAADGVGFLLGPAKVAGAMGRGLTRAGGAAFMRVAPMTGTKVLLKATSAAGTAGRGRALAALGAGKFVGQAGGFAGVGLIMSGGDPDEALHMAAWYPVYHLIGKFATRFQGVLEKGIPGKVPFGKPFTIGGPGLSKKAAGTLAGLLEGVGFAASPEIVAQLGSSLGVTHQDVEALELASPLIEGFKLQQKAIADKAGLDRIFHEGGWEGREAQYRKALVGIRRMLKRSDELLRRGVNAMVGSAIAFGPYRGFATTSEARRLDPEVRKIRETEARKAIEENLQQPERVEPGKQESWFERKTREMQEREAAKAKAEPEPTEKRPEPEKPKTDDLGRADLEAMTRADLMKGPAKGFGIKGRQKMKKAELIDEIVKVRKERQAEEKDAEQEQAAVEAERAAEAEIRAAERQEALDTSELAQALVETGFEIDSKGYARKPGERKLLIVETEGPTILDGKTTYKGEAAIQRVRERLQRGAAADITGRMFHSLGARESDTRTNVWGLSKRWGHKVTGDVIVTEDGGLRFKAKGQNKWKRVELEDLVKDGERLRAERDPQERQIADEVLGEWERLAAATEEGPLQDLMGRIVYYARHIAGPADPTTPHLVEALRSEIVLGAAYYDPIGTIERLGRMVNGGNVGELIEWAGQRVARGEDQGTFTAERLEEMSEGEQRELARQQGIPKSSRMKPMRVKEALYEKLGLEAPKGPGRSYAGVDRGELLPRTKPYPSREKPGEPAKPAHPKTARELRRFLLEQGRDPARVRQMSLEDLAKAYARDYLKKAKPKPERQGPPEIVSKPDIGEMRRTLIEEGMDPVDVIERMSIAELEEASRLATGRPPRRVDFQVRPPEGPTREQMREAEAFERELTETPRLEWERMLAEETRVETEPVSYTKEEGGPKSKTALEYEGLLGHEITERPAEKGGGPTAEARREIMLKTLKPEERQALLEGQDFTSKEAKFLDKKAREYDAEFGPESGAVRIDIDAFFGGLEALAKRSWTGARDTFDRLGEAWFENANVPIRSVAGRPVRVLEDMGPEGRRTAAETYRVDHRTIADMNIDTKAAHEALKGTKPVDRRLGMMLMNGRLSSTEKEGLGAEPRRIRDSMQTVYDRVQPEAGRVGIRRGPFTKTFGTKALAKKFMQGLKADDPLGSEASLAGSGKSWTVSYNLRPSTGGAAHPQTINSKGIQGLRDIKHGRITDLVKRGAEDLVREGKAESVEDAISNLVDYTERFFGTEGSGYFVSAGSGRVSYFESFRSDRVPREWIEWDPLQVVQQHARRTWGRVHGAHVWGPKFQELEARRASLKDSHGVWAERAVNFIAEQFGAKNRQRGAEEAWISSISSWITATKLTWPTTWVRNYLQPAVNSAGDAPWWLIAKAYMKLPPFFAELSRAGREYRDATRRAGAIMQSTELHDIRASKAKKLVGALMKPFSLTEIGTHARSAYIGGEMLKRDLRTILAVPESRTAQAIEGYFRGIDMLSSPMPRRAKNAMRRIRRRGITDAEILQAMESGKWDADLIAFAQYRFVSDTQFGLSAASKRLFWDKHPMYRILMKFKPFGIDQFSLLRQFSSEALKGNPRPIIGYMMAAIIAGELVNDIMDLTTGSERSLLVTAFNRGGLNAGETVSRLLVDLMHGGFWGFVGDMAFGFEDYLLGPAASDGKSLVEFGYSLLDAPDAATRAESAKKMLSEIVVPVGKGRQVARHFDIFGEGELAQKYALWRGRIREQREFSEGLAKALKERYVRVPLGGRKEFGASGTSMANGKIAALLLSNDIEGAADVVRSILDGLSPSRFDKKIASLHSAIRKRAPFGDIPEALLLSFFARYGPSAKSDYKRLQGEYHRRWGEALKLVAYETRPSAEAFEKERAEQEALRQKIR